VPVTSGGHLRLARARTPAGTPADGVVSGGRFIPLGAFAALDGVTIADLLARGRFLQPGDLIEAAIGQLGQQRNRCVAERVPESRLGGRRAA